MKQMMVSMEVFPTDILDILILKSWKDIIVPFIRMFVMHNIFLKIKRKIWKHKSKRKNLRKLKNT